MAEVYGSGGSRGVLERESPVVVSRGGDDPVEEVPVPQKVSTVFDGFDKTRAEIASLTQMVATLATSVSTLQSALADAPSLADISGAINTALDVRVGVEEHTDESTQLAIKLTLGRIISATHTLVEELAKDNPIPFVWHEAMLEAILKDVVDSGITIMQARAAWVRREAGAVPIEANNTMAMMYGVTHKGNALVLMYQSYVYTSQEQERFEMKCQVMSDTNPTSMGKAGQVDADTMGHFAQMHERFQEALKEMEQITEMTLVTYGGTALYNPGVPNHSYIQAIQNPFTPQTAEYNRYESSRCPAYPSGLLRAAALWPENISEYFYGSLIAIHYLSPGATSLFPPY
jgi:hypothetical protein